MPVKIESFEPFSEEEFQSLQQQKARKTDPTWWPSSPRSKPAGSPTMRGVV
jgi:hypothetical protein